MFLIIIISYYYWFSFNFLISYYFWKHQGAPWSPSARGDPGRPRGDHFGARAPGETRGDPGRPRGDPGETTLRGQRCQWIYRKSWILDYRFELLLLTVFIHDALLFFSLLLIVTINYYYWFSFNLLISYYFWRHHGALCESDRLCAFSTQLTSPICKQIYGSETPQPRWMSCKTVPWVQGPLLAIHELLWF